MKIAAFCIKHKVATILAYIMIAVFGFIMYGNLALALMPDMETPYAIVTATYPGASPADVEELVTRPIESSCASVSGLKNVTSTSYENYCMVMLEFEEGTDMDYANLKVREKLDLTSLPSGVDDPTIMNINMDDMMPTMMIALMGDDLGDLQILADDTVVPALERLDGVGSVSVNGGVENRITVEVDTARVQGYNMSISYLSNFLAAANVLYPGGDVDNGAQTMTARTDAQFKTVDDVKNVLITTPAGGTVRLSDVADVYEEEEEQTSAAKVNGQYCVLLSVSKQSDANMVDTAEKVNALLPQLAEKHPTMQYQTVYDSSDYVKESVSTAMENIVLGVVIAGVVIFLFLRRFGATAAIAVSMPVCILTVFVLMKVGNLTMNMMSLAGIAMGVGMIVDNSIVILENIFRFRSEGYSRYDACVQGAGEMTFAIIGSTLTTCAVYIPLGLAGGMAGQMFKDFCLTIAFLILSSLIIAMTLVPLLCYYLLGERNPEKVARRAEKEQKRAARGQKMQAAYARVLRKLLKKRWIGVVASLALCVFFGLTLVGSNMVLIPDMDQGMVQISLTLPTGSDLDESARLSDRVTAIAQEQVPEIDYLYYSAQSTSSTVNLVLVSKDQRDRSSKQVANDLRPYLQDIAGADITVEEYSMASMMVGGGDISLKISGDDMDMLEEISKDLAAKIGALDDAVDVTTSIDDQAPQVNIAIDRENAAHYGLTAATIGGAVRAELTGATATTMTMDGNELDVVVKGSGASAASLDALRSMPLAASTGGTVPLSAVAEVTVELAPQSIARENQTRTVSVTGSTLSGNSTAMTKEIDAILADYTMPDGYTAETDGTYESMMDNFQSLALALTVAIGLVYFILAAQFESFIMPVIILMILPIALLGGLFGLPITGNDVSMMSFVGLIMLAGNVVNASIVLVDYINIRRGRGESRDEAILNACPRRVRPVMMTTLTTVLGLIPMALSQGEGSEVQSGMAIVMMAGMLISTAVTLVFTPVYYSLIDSLTNRIVRFFKKRRRPGGDPLLKGGPLAHDGIGLTGEYND